MILGLGIRKHFKATLPILPIIVQFVWRVCGQFNCWYTVRCNFKIVAVVAMVTGSLMCVFALKTASWTLSRSMINTWICSVSHLKVFNQMAHAYNKPWIKCRASLAFYQKRGLSCISQGVGGVECGMQATGRINLTVWARFMLVGFNLFRDNVVILALGGEREREREHAAHLYLKGVGMQLCNCWFIIRLNWKINGGGDKK